MVEMTNKKVAILLGPVLPGVAVGLVEDDHLSHAPLNCALPSAQNTLAILHLQRQVRSENEVRLEPVPNLGLPWHPHETHVKWAQAVEGTKHRTRSLEAIARGPNSAFDEVDSAPLGRLPIARPRDLPEFRRFLVPQLCQEIAGLGRESVAPRVIYTVQRLLGLEALEVGGHMALALPEIGSPLGRAALCHPLHQRHDARQLCGRALPISDLHSVSHDGQQLHHVGAVAVLLQGACELTHKAVDFVAAEIQRRRGQTVCRPDAQERVISGPAWRRLRHDLLLVPLPRLSPRFASIALESELGLRQLPAHGRVWRHQLADMSELRLRLIPLAKFSEAPGLPYHGLCVVAVEGQRQVAQLDRLSRIGRPLR
mmetsp:Transcript_134140/g.299114  ORF Transcript_134140/g.299114 Transcript_134140/m.299114 type:complete len:369 (-) Transcript_134140:322-1428(-)